VRPNSVRGQRTGVPRISGRLRPINHKTLARVLKNRGEKKCLLLTKVWDKQEEGKNQNAKATCLKVNTLQL